MQYTVTNGQVSVNKISIVGITGSSQFIVGDTKTVCLSTIFEDVPESVIVGVTTGVTFPAASLT